MDIAILTEKLAEILGKLSSQIDEVNVTTEGKPFYGRIDIKGGRHLTGLIEGLRMNGYKLVFEFTIEKIVDGKPVQIKRLVKLRLEEFAGITLFQTKDGKKLFLNTK